MYLKIERPTVFISRTPSPPRLPRPRRINFRVRQRRHIPYISQCRINFRTLQLRRCTQSFQPWQHPNAAAYADTTKTATPPLRRCRYLLRCCAPSDFTIPSAPPISTISTFPHVPSSSYVSSIPLVPPISPFPPFSPFPPMSLSPLLPSKKKVS